MMTHPCRRHTHAHTHTHAEPVPSASPVHAPVLTNPGEHPPNQPPCLVLPETELVAAAPAADPLGRYHPQARYQFRSTPINKLMTFGCFGFCDHNSSKQLPVYPWRTQARYFTQTKNIECLQIAAAEAEESLRIARLPRSDRNERQKMQKKLPALSAELARLQSLIATRTSERDSIAFI